MDGTRICIMRSYNPDKHPDYASVDEHLQDLSPSSSLLSDYRKGMGWDQYVRRFTAEVLVQHSDMVKDLAERARGEDLTLLCYEREPAYCHRRLVALACRMYEPDLELHIR